MPPFLQPNARFGPPGQQIAYRQVGSGPPLLMLHNGGASLAIWQHQIAHFAQRYTIYALDLPGFGASDRPEATYGLDFYVGHLRHFITGLGLRGPTLMGNCIGAAMALTYAERYPGEVSALILVNVCGGASMMRHAHPYLFTRRGAPRSALVYRWLFWPFRFEGIKRQIIDRLYGARVQRDELYLRLLAGIKHPQQPQSRLRLIHGMPSFSRFDHEPLDGTALPPTLVCWGTHNRVLPLHRGASFIARLGPTRWEVFPQAGHLLMAEAPEAFNQRVDRFLTKHATG